FGEDYYSFDFENLSDFPGAPEATESYVHYDTMWQFERMLVGSPVVYKSWRAYGGGDKVAEWETTRQRQRRLYTYNAAGRVSHVLSLRYFGTTLDSSTQSFFFYNAAGGVVKDSLVVFDRTTRQWTPINQNITTYDGAGKVTL